MEHYVLHRFRNTSDFIKELDFLMEYNGRIIGQVAYVKSAIETEKSVVPITTFGPICILPEYRRLGLGRILLEYSLKEAAKLGFVAVAITGDAGFYGKIGFVKGKDVGVFYGDDPYDNYFLVKELKKGALSEIKGVYKDPKGYFVAQNEPDSFAEYDKTFVE